MTDISRTDITTNFTGTEKTTVETIERRFMSPIGRRFQGNFRQIGTENTKLSDYHSRWLILLRIVFPSCRRCCCIRFIFMFDLYSSIEMVCIKDEYQSFDPMNDIPFFMRFRVTQIDKTRIFSTIWNIEKESFHR